ncbi:MAG: response regulator [Gammaproteobacteria bacterium]|nr:response regulator [Gammaproteobacteria bacterium]
MESKQILIVEDDRTAAAIMQVYLDAEGYEVADIAASGAKAIKYIQTNKPDLILMDIHLGEGLDGIQTAELINERFIIPIVYITAYNDNETLARAQTTNPAGFINKPIRESDLRTTLKMVLDGIKPENNSDSEQAMNLGEILALTYGLSPAEVRVLEQLLVNSDLDVVSENLNIKLNTVRTHLKKIYRKTDCKSKSELLLKVISGPAKTAIVGIAGRK